MSNYFDYFLIRKEPPYPFFSFLILKSPSIPLNPFIFKGFGRVDAFSRRTPPHPLSL